MLSAIIPEIPVQFNFDGVLLLILSAYFVYGYISGGHKQIRLSINLILPFVILYYLGPQITEYLYAPLSQTLFFEIVSEYLDFAKNIITMIFAYIATYIVIFTGVFILSIYARRYLLNENMRAKLGRKNNYIGALFSLLNGYVLVYFIILPAFGMSLVSTNSVLTNFVLEHPPPFSRLGRTAEQAVPIKNLADKADQFQTLISNDGIQQKYEEAFGSFIDGYLGSSDSYEADFMTDVYPNLTSGAKTILNDAYFAYFGEQLSSSNFYGVSYILISELPDESYLYESMMDEEDAFKQIFEDNYDLVADYLDDIDQYEIDLANYEYTNAYNTYETELDDYLTALLAYETLKVQALINGDTFTDEFTLTRPEVGLEEPDHYVPYTDTTTPVDPEESITPIIQAALDYVEEYEDKDDIRPSFRTLATNFEDHAGILTWLVQDLGAGSNEPLDLDDISTVIVSFKTHYEAIREDTDDEELETKLYDIMMAIRTYDVFIVWLDCTMGNIDTVELDDIALEANRCPAFNASMVTEYNFTDNALNLVGTLFEGESVSWIISQFKYDYDNGYFDEPFDEFEEVQDILLSTKDLVDEYDAYYKDIASSIEGNIPMIMKIGISVMKKHLDVYETLKNTPLLGALFNDAARFCGSPDYVQGYDVKICKPSDSDGMFSEIMNVRYLVSEIYFKAYFMVDENNEAIVYDSDKMNEYLATVNQAVQDNVITVETIEKMADQFAFNVVDETNGTTLLEQMYLDGSIEIEAMRILGEDPYGFFSDDFRTKVKSLIR